MKAALLCLALIAAASAPAAAQTTAEEHNLMIEIGRWEVMLGQIDAYAGAPEEAGAETSDAGRSMARSLRETVWALNLRRSRLCAAQRFTEVTCTPAYAPSWLSESPSRRVTTYTLEQRSAAVGRALMPLWGAVCEDARANTADEEERMYVCAIE